MGAVPPAAVERRNGTQAGSAPPSDTAERIRDICGPAVELDAADLLHPYVSEFSTGVGDPLHEFGPLGRPHRQREKGHQSSASPTYQARERVVIPRREGSARGGSFGSGAAGSPGSEGAANSARAIAA